MKANINLDSEKEASSSMEDEVIICLVFIMKIKSLFIVITVAVETFSRLRTSIVYIKLLEVVPMNKYTLVDIIRELGTLCATHVISNDNSK